MTTTALCVYCAQLPEEAPRHAARVMRCPLCKTDLGVTGGGQKFRLADGAVATHHGGKHTLIVAVGIAFAVLGALLSVVYW